MKPNLLLLIFFVAFQTLKAQNQSFAAFSIPDSLTVNANAVVRIFDTEIDLESSRKMTVKIKKAVTILNKNGNDNAEFILYYSQTDHIQRIDINIYNSFGIEEKHIKNKEIRDFSASGSSLFSEFRAKYYKHVPISYPYTIYYEYEVKSLNTAFIPIWSPIYSYDLSVENSSFKLIYPESITVRKLEKNSNNFNVKIHDSINSLDYEIKNAPAIKYEDFSPSISEVTPQLMVATNQFHLESVDGMANNWKEFGKWRYDYLYNGNDKINDGTKAKVSKMVEGISDPIEKAKIIYNYVQKKTRYISVQEGIGGWKPIKADEVDKVGYGDCKGLTNYTKTLMDAVGVKSYYSVVWAGDEIKNIEKDFFSMQGNHIILNLPTDTGEIWLECTDQDSPFNYEGTFTDDRNVLVITPEGGIIKHTHIYKNKDNFQKTNASYEIGPNGNFEGSVQIKSGGIRYSDHFRLEHETERNIMDYYKSHYWSYLNNLNIKDYQFKNNKDSIIFTEKLNVSAADYAKFSGDRLLFEINAFNKSRMTPDRYRNRKLSVEISRGFLDEDAFIVTLPKGYSVEAIPQNIKIENKFGTYTAIIEKVSENELKYSRSFLLKKGKYAKEDYKAFRNFLKNVTKYDNSKIVLLKNQS